MAGVALLGLFVAARATAVWIGGATPGWRHADAPRYPRRPARYCGPTARVEAEVAHRPPTRASRFRTPRPPRWHATTGAESARRAERFPMAVKMRLRREGKTKQPNYRVVVADARSPRDGRFLEDLGYYQPLAEPSAIKIDHDRALAWLRHGAQPSQSVVNLLRIEGVWEAFRPGEADAQAERRQRRARRRAERAAHKTPGAAVDSAAPAAEAGAGETATGDADAGEGEEPLT